MGMGASSFGRKLNSMLVIRNISLTWFYSLAGRVVESSRNLYGEKDAGGGTRLTPDTEAAASRSLPL